jgi:nucleotide-binding universal stress UspA family protein
MFKRVIVPLDGSNGAEIALPYAADLARAFKSEVTLVTVAETGTPDKSHLFEAYLKRVSGELERSGIRVSASVLEGKPADEILKLEVREKADIAVIAARGASGGNPQLPGSIASKILSGSSKPVLLVRAAHAPGAGRLIKRILVPLDGSPMSERSLKIVEPMAAGLGAEIVLFQAVEPVRYVPGFETMVPNVVLPSDDEIKRSAGKYLADVAGPLKGRGARVSSAVVADAPAEAIIDYADSGNIDLIAMTTHGFSGIKRWVFGSTTQKVLQAGSKPVLVIPTARD